MREEDPLSLSEVAARLGIPARLVAHWARAGRITTYHNAHGRPAYLVSEVRRMLSDRPARSPAR